MLARPPRRLLLAILTGALPVALVCSGCKKTPPVQKQGPLPVNVIAAVEKEVTEWDEFTGRTEAVESVDIHARVSGYLQSVNFKAGALVNAGDLLFVIDPRPYQADLDRTTADLERGEAQLKLAEIDFKRAQELRQKGVLSPEEFDQKAAALKQAQAVGRSAKAAKDSAALNIDFTQIKSPIAGRVSNERVTVGNLVQAGSATDSVLTTVVSTDPIYVYADADENSILRFMQAHAAGTRKSMSEEQVPAFIQLANETDFPHEGALDFADNRIDPTTGTLRIRGVFKTWDALLTPGFFVRMRVPAGPKVKAVLLEDKMISSQQGVKFVYVVKSDNTIERRNLQTGSLFEGMRIVREGVKAGESVVSTRLQMLQPGMPVMPVVETPKPVEPAAKEVK
ncbi:MAG: hypothetical protein JWL90_4412 [Chthoniobacteraceae bacterium]|nr:hypothetical protein [Chthoniobacteraceae bacterium]